MPSSRKPPAHVLPRAARAQCLRGLRMLKGQAFDWRTMAAIARASRLAKGQVVDGPTLKAMQAFFCQHTPSRDRYGQLAALLWGGEPGRRWCKAQAYQPDPDVARVPCRVIRHAPDAANAALMDFIDQARRRS